MAPAALPVPDALVLLVLGAYALWGSRRGPLRGLLGLLLLAGAFALAGRWGPRIEGTVVKVVSVADADARAVAWGVVFGSILLGGALLFALLGPTLDRLRGGRPPHRLAGALLGLLQGALVTSVLLYGVLMAGEGGVAGAVERSAAAWGARGVVAGVRRAVDLPDWLERRTQAVDQRVGAAHGDVRP